MYLRNNGVYSVSEYKGKTIEEAEKFAKDGGFITRVVENNGNSVMVDALDVKSNRLNFRVRGGVVIDVFGG